ncbi:unnamed protein product [Lupinus luteus]|uniref:Uncharacterized protein n=1 Tax=Lupinus luteus TaxID=3873 RepID=A0AAV1W472_LUPLU
MTKAYYKYSKQIDTHSRGHANLLCIVPILSDVPEGTNLREGFDYINYKLNIKFGGVGLCSHFVASRSPDCSETFQLPPIATSISSLD